MARFSDETINRIKQEVSLIRLVEQSGVVLKPHGKDQIGCCPFHDDKTPSLVVSPDSNLWHCLGACQTGGSVIDWVMKTQGISFRHAVELLKNDIPSLAAVEKPIKKSTTKPLSRIHASAALAHPCASKLDVLLSEDLEAQQLLNQITDYYHETLKQSPEALEYLTSRGLGDSELIDRFKLGFANRTLGYRLPEKNRKAGAEIRGKLQEVGVLRSSGHEHMNGSIVVPIFDEAGNVCELYGRKILGARLRKGTAQHLYLPGPHLGVWNREGLEGQKEIILCEALIDAMTYWVAGYKNVTASYGTSGFTPDHLAAFQACGAERILIAYDRDEAGNTAADKLAEQLQQAGFACYRLHFPKGMDANQYALEVMSREGRYAGVPGGSTPAQSAHKSLGVVIRSAIWMGAGSPPERQVELETAIAENAPVEPVEPPPLAAALEPEVLAPAEAQPEPPRNSIEAEQNEREVAFSFGDRSYRVRGFEKNKNFEVMKINLLAHCGEGLHVDTFDLYSAKHRQGFARVAALELECEENTLKKDLGKILLKLEELQEKLIAAPVESKKESALNEDEKAQALELLTDPDLLNRILSDFSRCGVVGEETNKLVGYLAASSRKLEKPLAIVIQSTSAAGKSSLMDAVLEMMPEDERVHYSAMTGQSLFYMGETNLKHKILAIAEEEGAENASYALKLLQSDGQITIASTGKDESTGDMVTKEYSVEGPVMLFFTTTAIDVDEELLNRCTLLTVNESREQTRAIHEAQRKRRTLAGLQAKLEKSELIKLHRNAQKLLRPLSVINPFADQLTFLDDKTRTRRDHEKYLTLIDTIAFLHQYQREVKTINHGEKTLEYIEVQLSDIETANRLAHDVLGRTLDELPAQTRKLLKLIQQMVTEVCEQQSLAQRDYRFSRREVREAVQWSDTALKVHMARLVELEYLLAHRTRSGRFDYELLFDGDEEQHLMGLIDVEKLTHDANQSGQIHQQSEAGQPLVSGQSESDKSPTPIHGKALSESGQASAENTLRTPNNAASHRNEAVA